jgi:hypothetical protein
MRTTMEKFWQCGTEPNISSWAQMLQIDEHIVDAQSVEQTIPAEQDELKTMMTENEFTIEAIARRVYHQMGIQKRTHRAFRGRAATVVAEMPWSRQVLRVLDGLTNEDFNIRN